MPTVAELKKLIKAYKSEDCPFTSKMKKAQLMEFATKKGLIKEAEMMGEVKSKKAKEGKVEKAPSAYTMFVKKHFKPGMKLADVAKMWKDSDERKKAMKKEAPVEEKKFVSKPGSFDEYLDKHPEYTDDLNFAMNQYLLEKKEAKEEKKKVRRPVVAPEAVITEAMPTRKVKRPIVAPTAVAVEMPVRKIKKPVIAPSLVEIAPAIVGPVMGEAPKSMIKDKPLYKRKYHKAPITSGEIKKKD